MREDETLLRGPRPPELSSAPGPARDDGRAVDDPRGRLPLAVLLFVAVDSLANNELSCLGNIKRKFCTM